jgi:serine-type D-Ala-D-Ala carboxypeptidase/endopeptidase (penicillin-binding protein 4)
MRTLRVLCALILLVVVPAQAAPKKKTPAPGLNARIGAILYQPQMASATWGVDVLDLTSGKVIYSLNPDHLFLPASNAKLLTTAAALAIAGPDYRFHTTVETSGAIDGNGKLLGDLVIVGRGDANLSGRVLPYQTKTARVSPPTQALEELADQIMQKGVRMVDGDVVGDDTFYSAERYAEGWAYDDLQWLDGAPVSALSFNDNVVFFNVHPGSHVGDQATVIMDPDNAYYELDNRIETSTAGITRKIGIHHDLGSSKVTLWGSIPLGDSGLSEAVAIDDPALFTAEVFRTILERRGIIVSGKARARHSELAQFFDQPLSPAPEPSDPGHCCMGGAAPSPTSSTLVLAEHVSLPLVEDVRVTNKTSQNLHAELLLRLIGKMSGGIGSFEDGSASLHRFLLKAGIKNDEFFLLDGSGLSRRDLITPAAIVQLLTYAAQQPWGAAYEQTLPVAGADGSLAERFLNTAAGGLVHAKTGTLSHVNALSGYGETRSGRRFAFSIFCNNHNLPSAKVISAIDSMVLLIVKNSGL